MKLQLEMKENGILNNKYDRRIKFLTLRFNRREEHNILNKMIWIFCKIDYDISNVSFSS